MNLFIKIVVTVFITLLGAYPYWVGQQSKAGALDGILQFGVLPALLIIVLFFGAVALYCRDLQATFELVQPANRCANPKSVWLMFIIPYNIFEDFFIMINVSNSIEKETKENPKLAQLSDSGMITGIAWATAQVLSFVPNEIGQAAGLVGILLWAKHWFFIRNVNKALRA